MVREGDVKDFLVRQIPEVKRVIVWVAGGWGRERIRGQGWKGKVTFYTARHQGEMKFAREKKNVSDPGESTGRQTSLKVGEG